MPSLVVEHAGVEFFYTDSGLPDTDQYTTVVIIHGHTFHSGTFQRLLPLATSRSLRLICVNRREYPGSTPYTPQELKVFAEGSDSERATLINQEGVKFALFIDGLIQKYSLPKEGGVALAGWSLGNAFLLSLVASIGSFPAQTKDRLQAYVKRIIMWDPPSQSLEARGAVFGKWVAGWFNHGDLSTRDLGQFEYRNPDPLRKGTIESMTPEELLSMTGSALGGRFDTALSSPANAPVLASQSEKALFDPEVRAAWSEAVVWHMYGDANSWNIHYAAWVLEKKVNSAQTAQRAINFKLIERANHFLMWEDPEKGIAALEDCIRL